jgi:hypothetical protein
MSSERTPRRAEYQRKWWVANRERVNERQRLRRVASRDAKPKCNLCGKPLFGKVGHDVCSRTAACVNERGRRAYAKGRPARPRCSVCSWKLNSGNEVGICRPIAPIPDMREERLPAAQRVAEIRPVSFALQRSRRAPRGARSRYEGS